MCPIAVSPCPQDKTCQGRGVGAGLATVHLGGPGQPSVPVRPAGPRTQDLRLSSTPCGFDLDSHSGS